jgi:uncharacterized YigZ family protein
MVTMSPPPAAPYPVPAGPVDAEIVIHRSRFLAALRPVATRAAALAELDRIRATHPDATHHCYAYLVGSPASGQAAMSDDGEPSGTAGRPIFSVIGHKGVGDVLVVVTRYFGGIKLGAGGLVRAYSAAAEAVASQMVVVDRVEQTRMTLHLDFADEQPVRHWCAVHGARIEAVEYGEAVRMVLEVPREAIAALQALAAARGIRSCG